MPDGSERIAEGGLRLGVPRRCCSASPLASGEPGGQQRDDREQGEQARRGARDRLVRPLPLRLDAEVGAGLLEGHLHLPASHKPGDDLGGVSREVGAKQSLGRKAVLGIADQDPADRHNRQARVSPDRRGGRDLDPARARPVPAQHDERLPRRALVRENLGQGGQPYPLRAWATDCAWQAGWSRIVEGRVQPQARYGGDAAVAHGIEEQERGEAAVAYQHEVAPPQPATRLKGELPPDVEQGPVPTTLSREVRSEGTRAVRNGSAQTRPAQGRGASSIKLIHRRPLVLTKWASEERTGSR